MSDSLDIAWAAGIFEGEGCVSGSRRRHWSEQYWYTALSLRMTDKDVVDRFHAVVGVGGMHELADRPGLKKQWGWKASALPDVLHVLEQFAPWFGERRSVRAINCLSRDTRLAPKPSPPTHCPHGHEWNEANTYRTKKGTRTCRACLREGAKHRYRTDPEYRAGVNRRSREYGQRRRTAQRNPAWELSRVIECAEVE